MAYIYLHPRQTNKKASKYNLKKKVNLLGLVGCSNLDQIPVLKNL